jgi:RNA polymerase sigma factor (TIGR02999 family)
MADGAPTESVTDLLIAWRRGGTGSLDHLMERVYPELRRLARIHLSRERDGAAIEPNSLVHQAYVRLVEHDRVEWRDRCHFYAIAGRVMRQVLVDRARARNRAKRRAEEVTLKDDDAVASALNVEVLALHEALGRLEAEGFGFESEVVHLRFFAGLGLEEIAEHLGASRSTVARAWAFARAWLYRELGGGR